MKKVGVVILNYKVAELTIKCVESVLASSYSNIEVIVVDNDSSDDLPERIKKFKVEFIQNKVNVGYTGGNNVGIKKVLGEADLILILNPDTKIQKGTVGKLVEAFNDSLVGIVGPKIYFDDSKKIWYAGGILDQANVLGTHRGVDQEDRGQFDQSGETDYVTGAAMMVKSEVFKKIGLLDEDYFLYYEDSDFCFRARKAGYKIMYIPAAVVYHKNAQSTGLGSPLQDYFITRNRLLFASKFLPIRTRLALFREAVRNFSQPNRRLALLDFMRHNLGKGSFIK